MTNAILADRSSRAHPELAERSAQTTSTGSARAQADLARSANVMGTDRQTALRFITCGSVDDGKSTLIGRLLVDSKSVLQDQLAGVQRSGVTRSRAHV